MTDDTAKEVQTIQELTKLFEELDAEAVKRVIIWAASHYGVALMPGGTPATFARAPSAAGTDASGEGVDFEDFATLYDEADPKSGTERALVAGYWLQVVQGAADFGGQSVNDELKNMGNKVANITVAFIGLQDRKPALARQVKGGKSKKARKRYKLTTAGIRKVNKMLSGETEEG